MNQEDPEQWLDSPDPSAVERRAVEGHGRVVTATMQAAAFYRQAQHAVHSRGAVTALRLAVKVDPAFGLAVADLGAITETTPIPLSGRKMNWERHHIEVVRTAASGNLGRAADLLREYLASVGCDPLAVRIVADLRWRMGIHGGLDDFTSQYPACHAAIWQRIR
jgi:hypothetical protein